MDELEREAADLLDAVAPMPPPRAVVVDLDELLGMELVHLCAVCGAAPAAFPAIVCAGCRERSFR